MSSLLIQEEFVAYLPSLARVVGGIPEAVTLQAIWWKADKATGELVMSRTDLADYLGTSPSSVGRYVKHLAGLGVLTYEGRSRVGYDKTTKYTVDPAALDALVQDAATGVGGPLQDAATAPAGSSGSQRGSVQDAPTRMGGTESVNVTHSQSVNLTHSSTKKEEPKNSSRPSGRNASTSDGFNEFWGQYPATRYKGRRDECKKLWLSLPHEDRQDAYRALMHYKESVIWSDEEGVSAPLRFLQNEPWLEVRAGTLPRKVKKIKMLTAEDIRLPD